MPYLVGQRKVYLVGEKREEFPVDDLALPPGQVQDYVELKEKCRGSGTPFVDPLFNPDFMDVLGRTKSGKKGIGGPIVAWKRPRDVEKKWVFGEKDEMGRRYGHDDVGQGRLGDCYYLSAVSILSDNDKWINFIIPQDNNEDEQLGIFHFRFWINGFHFDVVVDDRLPFWNETELACAKLRGNEYWPALIEKAYAKIHGSYGRISRGYTNDALEDFTGGFIRSIFFKDELLPWDPLLPQDYFGSFCGISSGTGSDACTNAKTGIVRGHAYALLDRTLVKNNGGETVRLFLVRNPHGHNEWIGDWSDSPTPSPKWETIPPADKDRLLSQKDDGQFWISYEDVTNKENFVSMEICYWLRNLAEVEVDSSTQGLWQWKDFHGEWEGPTAKRRLRDWELIASRPQYRVEMKGGKGGKGTLILSLMWKGRLDGVNVSVPQYAFKVFEVKDKSIVNDPLPYDVSHFTSGRIVSSVDFRKKIFNTRSLREFCTGCVLKDGHYVITPYTERGDKGRFLLRVIAEGVVHTSGSPSTHEEPEMVGFYRGWENGYRNDN